jgi:hypothetical protein
MSMRWARAAPKTATLESAQVIDFRDGVLSEYAESAPHEVNMTTASNLRRAAVLRAAALPPARKVVATQAAAAGLVRMAAGEGETGSQKSTTEKIVVYLRKIAKKLANGVQNVENKGGRNAERAAWELKKDGEQDFVALLDTLKGGVTMLEEGTTLSLLGAEGVAVKVFEDKDGHIQAVIDKKGVREKAFDLNVEDQIESFKKWWDETFTDKVKAAMKKDDQRLTDITIEENEERSKRLEEKKAQEDDVHEVQQEKQTPNARAMFTAAQLEAALPGVIAEELAKETQLSGPKFTEAEVFAAVRDSLKEFHAESQNTQVSTAALHDLVRSAVQHTTAAPCAVEPTVRASPVTFSSRPRGSLITRLRPL